MTAPTVRLAMPGGLEGAMQKSLAPTVRLSIAKLGEDVPKLRHVKAFEPPHLRLALGGAGHSVERRAPALIAARSNQPALLVAFPYLKYFTRQRHKYHFRDWVLDSGAFTAHSSGKPIVLADYINCCREMASDPKLTEIYSLDVIGDWRGSAKNTAYMWKAGIEAIPTYHIGEPWDVLLGLARDYPKIALGGVAMKRGNDKLDWARRCLSAVWPKKVHGFGFGLEEHLLAAPFHSADATNWEIGPCRYGCWAAFNGAQIPLRGGRQNLRAQVEYYLAVEAKARSRWRKEMAELEAL